LANTVSIPEEKSKPQPGKLSILNQNGNHNSKVDTMVSTTTIHLLEYPLTIDLIISNLTSFAILTTNASCKQSSRTISLSSCI